MSVPDKACCPQCGESPTDQSIAKRRLSDVGYHHEDVRLECSNDHSWQVGIPTGTTESDKWVCPCCGGDFMPHFLYITDKVLCRPKCTECYYVPDEKIAVESRKSGVQLRAFIGHHRVTGERGSHKSHEF